MYYDSYPDIEEWTAVFQAYNASRNGELMLDGLSVNFIRIMNTIGSGLLMLAMGLATDVNILVKTLKKPALCIFGVFTQFICMPVAGIILIKALKMQPLEGLATYLLALSPGGGTSNLMCYYMDLSLELSITLTFVCSVAAFGVMPAYLELLPYILSDYSDELFEIPFIDLVQNLALVIGCLLIGFTAAWFKPEASAKSARIVTPVSYAIVCTMVIINFVKYSAFGILTKQSLIVMIVIGPMGAFLSYFVTLPLSFLPESVLTKLNCGSKKPMDLSNKMKHSVACEVGNQNAVLSQLVMMSAFVGGGDTLEDQYILGFVLIFPVLVIFFQQAEVIMIILSYKGIQKFFGSKVEPEKKPVDDLEESEPQTINACEL